MSRETGMRGFSVRSWVAPHPYASPRNGSGPGGQLQCTGGATEVDQGGNGSGPELREELRHNNPFRERIASSGDEVLSMNFSHE
jgi:hypothetical protein